jgi:hypothetical protein
MHVYCHLEPVAGNADYKKLKVPDRNYKGIRSYLQMRPLLQVSGRPSIAA